MTLRSFLFSVLLGVFSVGGALAQVPSVLHYQATLLEDDQQVEGEIAVTARIFDVESGGQALWTEARTQVPVVKGRLSVLLGSQTPFPATLFDDQARFLEIEINGERLPRLRMASAAYALRAGVAAAVAAGAVDGEALAPGTAVTSINDIPGALTIEGANGATVNVDPTTGTITISAPGGSSGTSGIFGIQNNDGTLQVVDPNGPTTTINVQPGGIGATQIADGGVQTAELADGAVTARKLADQSVTTGKLAPGAAVTELTAGTGLAATGSTGDVTLGIADDGVTAAQLAQNAVTRRGLAPNVVVDALNGLTGPVSLTSSDQTLAVAPATGSVDLTLAPGAAVTEIVVGETELTGPVALAAANGASLAVADGTITISAEGSGGTITEVTSGTGLTGGGTAGSVTLGVADGGIGAAQLADGAVAAAKIAANAVTGAKIADGAVSTADLSPGAAVTRLSVGTESLAGNVGLQGGSNISVSRVSGQNAYSIAFTGDLEGSVTSVSGQNGLETLTGTTGDVTLGVTDGGIGSTQLGDDAVTAAKLAANAVSSASVVDNSLTAADLGAGSVGTSEIIDGSILAADLSATGPSSGEVLSYDGSGLAWTSAASGDITRVTGTGGLTGDTQSGDASVSIANGGVTEARLADNAVTEPKIGAANSPANDQVLSYNGSALEWTNVASGDITGVTAGAGLSGGGDNGTVTLSLANEGVTEPRLAATNSAGTGQVLSYAGSGEFEWVNPSSGSLTSVATNGTLIGNGTSGNPLGLADNAVGSANVADGSLTAADLGAGSVGTSEIIDGSVSAADLGSGSVGTIELNTTSTPSTDQVLTYDGSGLAWTSAASGDITRVTGTGGLTGDTPSGDATISIANGGVTEARLADNAVTEPKLDATNSASTGQVLSYAGSGRFEWTDVASGGLTSVSSDATLTGDGTSDSPMGLAGNAVGSTNVADGSLTAADLGAGSVGTSEIIDGSILAADLSAAGPSSGEVLTYDGTGLAWTNASNGDITRVTGTGGLTGDTQSGDASVAIATGGVTGPRLANGVVTGGTNVSVTRDASDNFVVSAPNALTSAVETIAADGQTLSGDLTFATSGSATLSVSGNTVTFGGSSGGLTSVSSDATLTGDGTIGNPLGLAGNAVGSANVADGSLTAADLGAGSVGTSEIIDGSIAAVDLGAAGPSGGDVLGYDGSGLTWTTTGDITGVTAGTGLTGGGDSGTVPLSVAVGGIGSAEIADASIAAGDLNAGTGSDGYVLTYNGGAAGDMLWEVSGSSTSSIRFKSDVETIADAQALVERLRGVRFHWTADGRADVGLIAEEVAQVLPELVTYEPDGTTVRGLRYAPLVGVLIEAAKAQRASLDAARKTIAAQQAEVDALADRLARLEALVQSITPDAVDGAAQ